MARAVAFALVTMLLVAACTQIYVDARGAVIIIDTTMEARHDELAK
jgi:hypothetical protein